MDDILARSTIRILSLAQRTQRDLGDSLERLSSGLRIRSAVDDPGGLALADRLRADGKLHRSGSREATRVSQAVEIADAAVTALKSTAATITELLGRGGSQSLTVAERGALQDELDLQVAEYNRIVSSTTFNGSALWGNTPRRYSVQMSGAATDILTAELSKSSSAIGGNGTFGASVTYNGGTGLADMGLASLGDFNADGILDVAYGDNSAGGDYYVRLGNGDGSFGAAVSYASGANNSIATATGDINGDGNLDLVGLNYSPGVGTDYVDVLLGNGDGTFKTRISIASGVDQYGIAVGDVNNDGFDDVSVGEGNSSLILLGSGGGSLTIAGTYASGTRSYTRTFADVNNDGSLDLVAPSNLGQTLDIYLNNGDGTFQARRSYALPADGGGVGVGDINNDGNLDVLVGLSAGTGISVFLGTGSGSFTAGSALTATAVPLWPSLADLNNDGNLDLVVDNDGSGQIQVLTGNGNGTFAAGATYATAGSRPSTPLLADLNNDGAIDVSFVNVLGSTVFETRLGVAASYTRTLAPTALSALSVDTRASAAQGERIMDQVDDDLIVISGLVAGSTAKLESGSQVGNSLSAILSAGSDQIRSIDAAEELARKIALEIRANAQMSLLAVSSDFQRQILTLLST